MNSSPFNQHQKRIPPEKKPVKKNSLSPIHLLPILIIGFLLLFGGAKFWERFYNDPTLDPAEVAAAQKEAEEIAERHETWIQYALIATTNMKRPCLKCPKGIIMVTVKAGEVYKYGITTQGKSRYTQSQYAKLGVALIEQHRGDYSSCKAQEVNKILSYRFLPESRKPEGKLIRPPGNATKG